MKLEDIPRIILHRKITIVLIAAVTVVLSIAVFYVRTPEYTAETSLFVSAQVGDSPQQAYQGAQLSAQRVRSYTELVTSTRVLSDVSSRLGGTPTARQLARIVAATNAVDSVIIDVSATAPDPALAARIANATADVMGSVVNELERPTSLSGIAPVAVRTVQAALPPPEPSSPDLGTTTALGIVLGLGFGLGIALLKHALDTSIKTVQDLEDATDCSSLGTVPIIRDAASNPLVTRDRPGSIESEFFRQIRSNLQFTNINNSSQVVVITSATPGEGKSTTAINLAYSISTLGLRVALIEADLRRPKVSKMLGVDRSVGLSHAITGKITLHSATQPWGGGAFDLIASGPKPPNPGELLASGNMRTMLDELRKRYDYIIVDTPPLLPVADTIALTSMADGAILVARYDSATRTIVSAATGRIRSSSSRVFGCVLTMVPDKAQTLYDREGKYYGIESEKDSMPAKTMTPDGLWQKPTTPIDSNSTTVRLPGNQRPGSA